MITRLVDLVVFHIWDRSWYFRPYAVRLALRIDADYPPIFKAMYYRRVLVGMSPRAWRYVQDRYPAIASSWDCTAELMRRGAYL